tara:strand:- start:6327 stop:7520 length:1194 start_codon:yes stop_codon:yes gene_type:complete
MIEYIPLKEREKKIEALLKESKSTNPFRFEGTNYDLKIITIPQEFLIYRASNTRIFEDKEEYISKNKLEPNYLENNEEDQKIQNIIHEFLCKYVQSLEETYEKTEFLDPLKITTTGRVVNGNRRLCMFRNINTPTINCAVLEHENLQDEDLAIEAAEDMATEDKVPYKWTGKGANYVKLLKRGKSPSEIAQMRSTVEREVKQIIQGYEGAQRWLEATGKSWDTLGDKVEQIWVGNYGKKTLSDEEFKQNAILLSGIVSFADVNQIGQRKYNSHTKFIRDAENAKQVLMEVFGDSSGESAFGASTGVDFNEAAKKSNDVEKATENYHSIEKEFSKIFDEGAEDVRLAQLKKLMTEADNTITQAVSQSNQFDDLETDGINDSIKSIEENLKKIKKYISK